MCILVCESRVKRDRNECARRILLFYQIDECFLWKYWIICTQSATNAIQTITNTRGEKYIVFAWTLVSNAHKVKCMNWLLPIEWKQKHLIHFRFWHSTNISFRSWWRNIKLSNNHNLHKKAVNELIHWIKRCAKWISVLSDLQCFFLDAIYL